MAYVGISCFMDPYSVQETLDFIPPSATRRLMVGTVVSPTTLAGGSNTLAHKFPKIEDIKTIYGSSDPRALNLIHYARKDRPDSATLIRELEALLAIGGPNLHGFQFNFTWPDIEALTWLREERPDVYVVLQLSPQHMSDHDQVPRHMAERIAEYTGLADSILFDRSRGRGEKVTPGEIKRVFDAIRANSGCNDIGLGYAGGLNAAVLPDFADITRDYDASFDVENGVRIEIDTPRERLHLPYVEDFVKNGFLICG